jgi:hypothetical protein
MAVFKTPLNCVDTFLQSNLNEQRTTRRVIQRIARNIGSSPSLSEFL